MLELKEALNTGTAYDYVINDLTEDIVDSEKHSEYNLYFIKIINNIHRHCTSFNLEITVRISINLIVHV